MFYLHQCAIINDTLTTFYPQTLLANFMLLLLFIDLILVPKGKPPKFLVFCMFWPLRPSTLYTHLM